MKSDLLRHVEKDRKDTFETQYTGNKLLFKTYKKVLEEKVEKSYSDCEKISVHEYHNELSFLADQAGYRRALKEIIDLLP